MFVVLTAALVIGCGDSTGPAQANMGGIWLYTATNLTDGSGFRCTVSSLSLRLNQSGNTFSGTTTGGGVQCYAGSTLLVSQALGPLPVINGSTSGTSVTFDIESSDFHNVGEVQGGSMTGTTTLRVPTQSGIAVLSGSFAAARQ
jgi:hypothetical protein